MNCGIVNIVVDGFAVADDHRTEIHRGVASYKSVAIGICPRSALQSGAAQHATDNHQQKKSVPTRAEISHEDLYFWPHDRVHAAGDFDHCVNAGPVL